MPIYLVTQKGVPGERLVEADKPQQALNYVIGSSFETKRIDGRELVDKAKTIDIEVAGVDEAATQEAATAE